MVSHGLLHGGLYRQVGEITVRKLNIVVFSGLLCVSSLHVYVCVVLEDGSFCMHGLCLYAIIWDFKFLNYKGYH